MKHLIQKQAIEITAPGLQLAQRWESRASTLLRDVITPCLEQCFDEISGDDNIILIDKLEVDLGILHDAISNDQVRERVMQAVKKILHTHPATVSAAATVAVSDVEQFSRPEVWTNRRMERGHAAVECLIHFLLYGRLPWWAESGHFHMMHKQPGVSLNVAQLSMLVQVLVKHAYARYRLAMQFEAGQIAAMLMSHQPVLVQQVLECWKEMVRGAEDASVRSSASFAVLQKEYWAYWIHQVIGTVQSIENLSPAPTLAAAFRRIAVQHPRALLAFNTGLEATGNPVAGLLKAWIAAAHQAALQAGKSASASLGAEDKRAAVTFVQQLEIETQQSGEAEKYQEAADASSHDITKQENGSTNTSDTPANNIVQPDIEGGLYMDDAGLVLLHPFLSELFRLNGLWDGKEWTSVSAQHTAVLTLVWLAHGTTDIAEYEMVLPKLLCGMTWEEPVDVTEQPAEEHLKAAEEMMQAVIGHWKVIGNITADGLREGFIRRRAKLSTRKNGWLITVERKAQDVLLSRLPWGFSIIRLPWWQGMSIHVDWA